MGDLREGRGIEPIPTVDRDCRKALLQTRPVGVQSEEPTLHRAADLVDTVAEQKTSIIEREGRLLTIEVFSVQVDDRHVTLRRPARRGRSPVVAAPASGSVHAVRRYGWRATPSRCRAPGPPRATFR